MTPPAVRSGLRRQISIEPVSAAAMLICPHLPQCRLPAIRGIYRQSDGQTDTVLLHRSGQRQNEVLVILVMLKFVRELKLSVLAQRICAF